MVAGTPTPTLQSTPFFSGENAENFSAHPRVSDHPPERSWAGVFLKCHLIFICMHTYITTDDSRWFSFRTSLTTKLKFWGWSPKTPRVFFFNLCNSTRKYANLRVDWHQVAPTKDDRKLRTNKKIQKETQHQGFFPIRTITTTRTISIQNGHESSRIKLLVVITSVVKPLPELLPGDRVGVCELRLGGCAWRGGWEPQKIKRAVRHTDCKSKYYIIMYLRKEKPRKNSQDFFSLVGLYHDIAFLQGRFNAAQHFTTFNPVSQHHHPPAASNTHVHGAGPGSIATRRALGRPHWKSQSSSRGR